MGSGIRIDNHYSPPNPHQRYQSTPPPTPLDDELIQWDATPQESDEYASNPASDLAGFVHALSGDDRHDRRSCGLANMLGSEAETAPPDEPPPNVPEDAVALAE